MSRASDLAQRKAMRKKKPQPSKVRGWWKPVEPNRNPFKGVKRKHRLRAVRKIRAMEAMLTAPAELAPAEETAK